MRNYDLNFMHASKRPPPLGWGVLLAGAVSLYLGLQLYQDRKVAYFKEQQSLETARAYRNPHVEPIVPTYVSDVRWQKAVSELRHPWIETFLWLEHNSPEDAQIYLLNFTVDSSSGKIQLQAQAPRFEDGLGFLAKLQENPQFLMPRITAHDSIPSPNASSVWTRFTLDTGWLEHE